MTPTLEYILANAKTYIRPLHQRGIRVLIEVRSGNFSETEDGLGLGFGTMDMAAINELTKELKLIINKYGIDGLEFNDVGGGKNSYPPQTRNLKQFRKDTPLYPNDLFTEDGTADGELLSEEEIEAKLWREGGSNFSNLIQRANEALKETSTRTDEFTRVIMVRNTGHGGYLLSNQRMAYMPDSYSGAYVSIIDNLRYIVNFDSPNDDGYFAPHANLYNEESKSDDGEYSDDRYAPFAVDLQDQKDSATAKKWASSFLYKNPAGSTTSSGNQNQYGALYFTNLPPVSDTAGTPAYLTYFSMALFGRRVTLAGAGDYKKTW
jgi:hypothetical protein